MPLVDIDDSGRFKYILVRVSDMVHNESRTIVRGYNRFEFHGKLKYSFEFSPIIKTKC